MRKSERGVRWSSSGVERCEDAVRRRRREEEKEEEEGVAKV